jgi:hypothetical protein
MFPVSDATERIGQLDSNPSEFDSVYVGELVYNDRNEIIYRPTSK